MTNNGDSMTEPQTGAKEERRPRPARPAPAPEPEPETFLAPKKKTSNMDPTLRLASKLDRLLSGMPPWAREWSIRWLVAKYGPNPQEMARVALDEAMSRG